MQLQGLVPQGVEEWITDLLIDNNIKLKITRPRISKHGDHHWSPKKGTHQITVNEDLNIYSFYLTLIHEVAHAIAYDKNKSRNKSWWNHRVKIKPHGAEWKAEYSKLLLAGFSFSNFPTDICQVVLKHAKNPRASTLADAELVMVLRKYDKIPSLLLQDIEENTVFTASNGRKYVRSTKRRSRYICTDLLNRRQYLVSCLAPVEIED